MAGVSRGTISRYVNGDPYVSASAREAIEAAIAEVGYVPNTAARHLVMQRTESIAFIVHEPHSLFVDDPNIGGILLGANAALSDADHQMAVLIVDSERDTDRVARYLSGALSTGPSSSRPAPTTPSAASWSACVCRPRSSGIHREPRRRPSSSSTTAGRRA